MQRVLFTSKKSTYSLTGPSTEDGEPVKIDITAEYLKEFFCSVVQILDVAR